MSRRSSEVRTLWTPVGDARVHIAAARGAAAATLVLGHGAGGGVDAPDLVAVARALPSYGISVVRVEQPWRVAGRRVAAPPPTLDRAWSAVIPQLEVTGRLVVGGRSAGARVACRTAGRLGASGALALAFPLHPPGRPERSRLEELDRPAAEGLPVLVLQGTRDTFGGPAELPAVAGRTVVAVDGADHAFRLLTGGDRQAAIDTIVGATLDWLGRVVGESLPPGPG